MTEKEILSLLRSEEAAQWARLRVSTDEHGRWITLAAKTPADMADWVEDQVKKRNGSSEFKVV